MATDWIPHLRRAALCSVLILCMGLAGCGGDETEQPEEPALAPANVESLTGETFESTAVEGHELVAGTTITISFGPEALTASAGCNSIRGPYTLEDGVLQLGKAAGTLIGCPEDRQKQDEWLTTLLNDGLRAYGGDGELVLLGSGVEVEMKQGAVPGGPPPIVGTTWELNGYTDSKGNVASPKIGVRLPFLQFKTNETLTIFDGCDEGKGLADVNEEAGTIKFAVIGSTLKTCPGLTGEVAQAMQRVLTDETSFTFEGQNLVISRKGSSLTFAPG